MAEAKISVSDDGVNESETRRITFHYIKGNYFRSIHVDGAMGSVGPAGHLHLAVYGERRAIPRTTIHNANAEGELIDEETIVDGREGFVRELEADLVMSPEVALTLAQWICSTLDTDDEEKNANSPNSNVQEEQSK